MKPRRQRMIFVAVMVCGVGLAASLVFLAVGENMLYFFSPSQVKAGEAPTEHPIRVGGLVVEGSVVRGDGLNIKFDLSDGAQSVTVTYDKILPDLFREGQGIVATGRLGSDGFLAASEVLAKHDENYMPPEVAEALKVANKDGKLVNPHAGSTQ